MAAPVPVRHIARDRAASLLEMPEAKLCQVNHHINQAYIPAQTTLIVWRYRIHLTAALNETCRLRKANLEATKSVRRGVGVTRSCILGFPPAGRSNDGPWVGSGPWLWRTFVDSYADVLAECDLAGL